MVIKKKSRNFCVSKISNIIYIFSVTLILIKCSSSPDPNKLINETIKKAGGDKFKEVKIEYDFRGTHYKVVHNNGNFLYERIYVDTTQGIMREGMTNDSTYKEINGLIILLDDKEVKRIRNSINEVVYFNLLPYKLNDPAAIKEYIGDTELKGSQYHKIKVTFKEESGGDHYDDWFVFWINRENKKMDFFSYYFHADDTGSRFRTVKNSSYVGDLLFLNYENFTSDEIGEKIEDYDKLYMNGSLKKISDIVIENIRVDKVN